MSPGFPLKQVLLNIKFCVQQLKNGLQHINRLWIFNLYYGSQFFTVNTKEYILDI